MLNTEQLTTLRYHTGHLQHLAGKMSNAITNNKPDEYKAAEDEFKGFWLALESSNIIPGIFHQQAAEALNQK